MNRIWKYPVSAGIRIQCDVTKCRYIGNRTVYLKCDSMQVTIVSHLSIIGPSSLFTVALVKC